MSGKIEHAFLMIWQDFCRTTWPSAKAMQRETGWSLSTCYRYRGEGGEQSRPSAARFEAVRIRHPRKWEMAVSAAARSTLGEARK